MRAALLLGLLLLAGGSAGCFTCTDQLDVHHCREPTGRCDTTGEAVVEWNAERQSLFPDVGRLMEQGVEEGKHAHASWSRQQAEAFWRFHHVPLDRADKQVYIRDGDDLYHVRVLAC